MSIPALEVMAFTGHEKPLPREQPATATVPGREELAKLMRFRDRYYVVCNLSTAQIDSLRQLQVTTGKTFDAFIDDILALPGATLSPPRE